MSDAGKDIHRYSAADIKKYLAGELAPEEMHRMEAAALSDPFLADAMTGMELYTREGDLNSFESDLSVLQSRLRGKTSKKIALVWWKVAAAILLIVASAALLFFFTERNIRSAKTYAKNDQKAGSLPLKPLISDTSLAQSGLRSDTANAAAGAVAHRPPKPKRTIVNDSVVSPTLQDAAKSFAEAEMDSQATAASIAAVPAQRDDQQLNKALAGKAAGLDISKDTGALNDVVVIGYGMSRKKHNNISVVEAGRRILNRFSPEGGWDHFGSYVQQSKMDSIRVFRTGRETIEFEIDQNSRPGNIRVLNSLSAAHDSAVVRLLENGPDWHVLKGTKRKVTLSVRY